MKIANTFFLLILLFLAINGCKQYQPQNNLVRIISDFDNNWKFHLGDTTDASGTAFNDTNWRNLNIPHDWSIEGKFSKDNLAGAGGGALPGGIGWYRKTFSLPKEDADKMVYIDFDGIYHNSKVWINGHYLGKRPNGYISFHYDLTPYVHFGDSTNLIAVKVDNSDQPNSRWYSGSGIYRNVRLELTSPVHIAHWGTHITTSEVSNENATVQVATQVTNDSKESKKITLRTTVYNQTGTAVGETNNEKEIAAGETASFDQQFHIQQPELWSIDSPTLYKCVTQVINGNQTIDDNVLPFGIRYFHFDAQKGFSLNGVPMKINGVCMHHDLGCLGAAINTRAIQRQLKILKDAGVNAIRTSHNPPAPELLQLCDQMGFIVMDEAFDMWKKQKTKYDYSHDWDKWHKQDLTDQILRDRNHPSVMIWSIGNEILEQWDSTGTSIARELAGIVHQYDTTRPITSACNDPQPSNSIIKSGALDLIGFNYHHQLYASFPDSFPGQKFIATETISALQTRGSYDMPSDSIRLWPKRWDLPEKGNPDYTCSSYDNCHAPWGSTHEETLKLIGKDDFLSGQFIWTGFDYLGEPTPYTWPARSSYFGIVDLAGFPKDAYYLYQSEWTDKPVLHIFPHWNWKKGQAIDVWAYTNCDEVELFLNGKSMGVRKKTGENLHLMWRLTYEPGTLKAVGKKDGEVILTKEIQTAGKPAQLQLTVDRPQIHADGKDLAFVTVNVVDQNGTLVPRADNLVHFKVNGEATIAGVDNGSETSHEPFKANYRHAFNGKCLVVLQSDGKPGNIELTASAEGLPDAKVTVTAQ